MEHKNIEKGNRMDYKYDYVSLHEGFYRWLETDYLPGLAQVLFLKIIHLFYKAGWSEWIQVDNWRMMSLIQMKWEKNFIELRYKLIEKELIILVKGKKGSPNKYKLNDKIDFIKESKNTVNNEVETPVKTPVKEPVKTPVKTPVKQKNELEHAKENERQCETQSENILKTRNQKPKTKNKKESIANAIPKKRETVWGPVRVYGEFRNVLLADDEYEKLKELCGEDLQGVIDHLSSYIEMKGYKVKSHYLAIRKWVITAYKEQKMREERINSMSGGIGYGRYSGYSKKKLCTEYPE